MGMYSLLGPASFNHSLHFNFLPRNTIRGLWRSHWMVATSTLPLYDTSFVRFESLEVE
jgi:hypothetical protein